jgi:DNA-binding HxlR family transcriptional regulator
MPTPRAGPEGPHCDFEATFRLLGQKHVLHILRSLLESSPRRFNELRENVGVNSATMTNRLKQMEGLGLIRREVIRVIPRRVEYGLTPMGRDLVKIFAPMMEWREKYSG